MTVESNRAIHCNSIHRAIASWVIELVPSVLSTFKFQDGGVSGVFQLGFFYTSLHNLDTCHRLESIQKSFVEAYSYLKEYSSCGGGNIDLFCEKDEVYNSHGRDTKLKSGINVLA